MSSTHSVVRVLFASVLATPADNRPRRAGLVYPKVAQSKGSADRSSSKDLRWGWNKLSSPSTVARQKSTSGRLSWLRSSTVPYNTTPEAVFVVNSSSDDLPGIDLTDLKPRPGIQDKLQKRRSILTTAFRAPPPDDSKLSLPPLCSHSSSESSANSDSSLNTVSS